MGGVKYHHMKENIKRNEEIRDLRRKGLSYRKIGRIYGIDHSAILRICKRKIKDLRTPPR